MAISEREPATRRSRTAHIGQAKSQFRVRTDHVNESNKLDGADARKEDAIPGQSGWPAEPASRAGGATGCFGRESMLGIYIDGPSRAVRYSSRAPGPGCPIPAASISAVIIWIGQRIKFDFELAQGGAARHLHLRWRHVRWRHHDASRRDSEIPRPPAAA